MADALLLMLANVGAGCTSALPISFVQSTKRNSDHAKIHRQRQGGGGGLRGRAWQEALGNSWDWTAVGNGRQQLYSMPTVPPCKAQGSLNTLYLKGRL